MLNHVQMYTFSATTLDSFEENIDQRLSVASLLELCQDSNVHVCWVRLQGL
jgi:hypothetical protein